MNCIEETATHSAASYLNIVHLLEIGIVSHLHSCTAALWDEVRE